MLVLSRKVGEKIFIGENISITIVRAAQGVVRLGIEAPAHLPIVREELKNVEMAPEAVISGSVGATSCREAV